MNNKRWVAVWVKTRGGSEAAEQSSNLKSPAGLVPGRAVAQMFRNTCLDLSDPLTQPLQNAVVKEGFLRM